MGNPFLDRLAKDGANTHGKKSEQRVGKKMGARMHSNSGATRGSKSDASLKDENFRLEMKSTVHQTIALDMAWLVKIAHEALSHGQTPAVVLSFVDAEGQSRMRRHAEWVCMPLEAFKELIGS